MKFKKKQVEMLPLAKHSGVITNKPSLEISILGKKF